MEAAQREKDPRRTIMRRRGDKGRTTVHWRDIFEHLYVSEDVVFARKTKLTKHYYL